MEKGMGSSLPALLLVYHIANDFFVQIWEHAGESLDYVGMLSAMESLCLGCFGTCLPSSGFFC